MATAFDPQHHAPVVPAYPYNVGSYFTHQPGQHTPTNGARTPIPDDSVVEAKPLPAIAVDYLSHQFNESDVWASWKQMTRHKNEIANGVRLENASWRTWAKQRNKLKTISPETLNWLKESDITWLYGPLHTAVEPVPRFNPATTQDRLNLEQANKSPTKLKRSVELAPHGSIRQTGEANVPTPPLSAGVPFFSSTRPPPNKSILKYRTLSDILSMPGPTSPGSENDLDFSDQRPSASGSSSALSSECEHIDFVAEPVSNADLDIAVKPTITQTRSDSHVITRRNRTKPSPPRVRNRRQSSDAHHHHPAIKRIHSPTGSIHSTSSHQPEKRHISFNHRVDQCISVDVIEDQPSSTGRRSSSSSDSSENEVLTFRPSPRRAVFSRSSISSTGSNSSKEETHTIVKLAPTTLKSVENYPAPSPAVVFDDGEGDIQIVASSEDDSSSLSEEAAPTAANQPPDEIPEGAFLTRTKGRHEESESSEDDCDPLHYHDAPTDTPPSDDIEEREHRFERASANGSSARSR